MRNWRTCGAIAATLVVVGEAAAQIVLPPPGLPVAVPNGIGFSYHRRGLSVNGFLSAPGYAVGTPFGFPGGYAPVPFVPYVGPYGATVIPSNLPLYGVVDSRVNVQIIQPAIVVPPPRPQEIDLSGVDLDVVGPEALLPGWKPDLAKKPAPKAPAPGKPALAKAEIAKPAPVRPAPGVKAPPKVEPDLDDNQLLLKLGVDAFRGREYGLAALRFQQATVKDPGMARSWFLLGQAHFALGKYREAVGAIEQGLRLRADWPADVFRPRLDLYRGIEEDLEDQKTLLDATSAAQPKNAAFLFLQAYQQWFDGDRNRAVAILNKARLLSADPTSIDTFLKAAP